MEKLKVKNRLNLSFSMVYNSFVYLLLFELIYKGLIAFLFRPFLNIVVRIFIRLGGYDFLVNENILAFFTSFIGLALLALLVAIASILIYYEFSVLLLILYRTSREEEIDLFQLTELALFKTLKAVRERSIGLTLYILILIPILNIGLSSSLIPSISLPDFIVGELEKHRGGRGLLILLSLGLIYVFAKLFIVLPLMIFSDMTFKKASEKSFKLMRENGFKLALMVILGLLIWIGLTYLPLTLFEGSNNILFLVLKFFANISSIVFTALISPFMLAMSLSIYRFYLDQAMLVSKLEKEVLVFKFSGFIEKASNLIISILESFLSLVQSRLRIFIIVFLALAIGLSIYDIRATSPLEDRPLIIGHRGSGYGLENTIETIVDANKLGSDYVEIDILLSKDGIPMVIHDNNLRRLASINQKISNLTYEEIYLIEIENRGQKGYIPSLRDLAKRLEEEDIKLLLEFKSHGKEEKSLVDETIRVLEEEEVLDRVIFQTSSLRTLNEFRENYDQLKIGYIMIGKLGNFSKAKVKLLGVDFISIEASMVDKRLLRSAHKNQIPVYVWTVNDENKARELFKLGVDGIITDYPDLMRKIEESPW